MTLDLFGGRRLILAGGQLGLFWVGAGVAAFVLLVVLFRAERRIVSRRVGVTLLGLRLAAAGVLVGALFEPIAARTFREAVRGRVVVAVDVSESMSTADPGRSGRERVSLFKTLGISPADPIDAMSRREVARRLIGESGPLRKLEKDHDVQAFAFARETAPGTLATIAEALKTIPKPDDPAGQVTDWEPALREALKGQDKDAPVVGVVLVTDGRRNVESDAGPTVDRLAARGIPVYPVLTGTAAPPVDAAIVSVKAPESVYKGDVATIDAVLKLDGFAGRAVGVRLDRPEGEPIRRTITATGDGARPSVSFRVPMEEVGSVPLTLAIEPMEGDVRPDNNQRHFSVQVADDKAKVLLVDGEARWEFRYLRNALARDPRVAVEAVVFHQPNVGIVADHVFTYGTELPSREAASAANGVSPDPLGAFDVIVVGDVEPLDMPGEAWSRIESFVAERGGTLILSAGPRFAPAMTTIDSVRKLLPVLEPRVVNVDDAAIDEAHPSQPPGARFSPGDLAMQDAGAWPMLQLATDAEESRRRWLALPPLPWTIAGKAKPGASTLATAGDDPNAVILAAQPYGLGKVFWVGTDGTWRWRHRVGDAYHHRFWGQVVRWASAGKLAAGNAFVRFGPLKPHASEGEPVTIQARISEGVPGVLPDLLIAARVFKAGASAGSDALAVIPLRPASNQPRTYEGVMPSLPMGSYSVKLDVPGLTDALSLKPSPPAPEPAASLEIGARDGSERVELSAARDPLDRLAAATGGKVLADFEADSLPPLLRARVKQAVRTEETPLWDQPGALFLFFAIITIEWVIRKRVGLP